MDAARAEPDAPVDRFAALVAEASAAVGASANTLRSVRDRFRHAYGVESGRLAALRSELAQREAVADDGGAGRLAPRRTRWPRSSAGSRRC